MIDPRLLLIRAALFLSASALSAAVEANPAKLPEANFAGAKALAEYLVSARGRAFLADFAAKQPDGFPLFYPPDSAP